MNRPPRPDESVDEITTYQSLPPASPRAVSIRVPSLTPGGHGEEIAVPGGAQIIVPGAMVPLAHLAFKFALPVTAVIVCGVLVALKEIPATYFTTLIGLIFGIQIPSISLHAPPTVLHTIPKQGDGR